MCRKPIPNMILSMILDKICVGAGRRVTPRTRAGLTFLGVLAANKLKSKKRGERGKKLQFSSS
jgi:hypothetical protein